MSEKKTNSGLVILIFLVIGLFVAILMNTPTSVLFGTNSANEDPLAVETRIKAVGSVDTGNEPVVVAEAPQSTIGTRSPVGSAEATSEPAVVADAPPSKKVELTVPAVCNGCHSAGVLGAPKVGSMSDWNERAKQGIETLITSVTKGKGNMPPQGASFNRDQAKEAIEAMLAKSGL